MEYVFTDKTGTLTENNMEFIECCVDGHVYIADAICNGQVNKKLCFVQIIHTLLICIRPRGAKFLAFVFQVMPGSSSMDMIDTSPGPKARVRSILFL